LVLKGDAQSRQQRAERYTIEAVANALAILRAIAGRDVLALSDAAEVAGVSKSTAYRLLATLEGASLVERLPEGGYRAGIEAVRWASELLGQLDVRTVSLPFLHQLRQDTGETVNLAVLRDNRLVYVEILESPSPFRMADVPGATAPVHATALGKAVAVHLDPVRLGLILGPEPYERFTPMTPCTWPELNARLDAAREAGYAVDTGEVALGVTCVAAAIVVRDQVLGAISISAPQARVDEKTLERFGTLTREITGLIAARL
jgi:DNA-binding IclR family transcriptional regulator